MMTLNIDALFEESQAQVAVMAAPNVNYWMVEMARQGIHALVLHSDDIPIAMEDREEGYPASTVVGTTEDNRQRCPIEAEDVLSRLPSIREWLNPHSCVNRVVLCVSTFALTERVIRFCREKADVFVIEYDGVVNVHMKENQ